MINILILGIVAIFQEAAFTWSSRSRNSGDHKHHFWAVCTSTAMYFVMQVFLMKSIWESLNGQGIWYIVLTGVVFTICSAFGSSYAMRILLKLESGLKRVGANPNDKPLPRKRSVNRTKTVPKTPVQKKQVEQTLEDVKNNRLADYTNDELEYAVKNSKKSPFYKSLSEEYERRKADGTLSFRGDWAPSKS